MKRSRTLRISMTVPILLTLLLFSVPGCAQTASKRITVGELNTILENRQAVVVDVREKRSENKRRHSPGSEKPGPG